MLTSDQRNHFKEHGFLHIPGVFSSGEMDALETDLDFLMDRWAFTEMGWTGPHGPGNREEVKTDRPA